MAKKKPPVRNMSRGDHRRFEGKPVKPHVLFAVEGKTERMGKRGRHHRSRGILRQREFLSAYALRCPPGSPVSWGLSSAKAV